MNESKAISFIREAVPAIASIVGIIMMAIGGTMFLNTVLKWTFIGENTYQNEFCLNEERLDLDLKLQQPKCNEEEEQERAKRQYAKRATETLIEGGTTFFVGGLLWAFHRKRKEA